MTDVVAANCLDGLAKQHPYLFIRDGGIDRLKERISRSEALSAMSAALTAKAEEILPSSPAEPVRDTRNTILATSRRVLGRVQVLGLAYLLTGGERYARRAVDEMLAASEYEDWDPGHFLDTAEMTCALGTGYDWLFAFLSDAEKSRICDAIVAKGLEPFLAGGWWATVRHNWNQVCNGGCLVGALAVANERPALAAEAVARAVTQVPLALRSYGREGGWSEGPMYWGYATRYTVAMLAALETALGHDFGLSAVGGLCNAGDFWIHTTGPGSQSFNFADATHRAGSQPALFWLARRFGRPDWAAFERERVRADEAMALLWYVLPEEMDAADEPATCSCFSDTHVVCLRTGWEADAVYVGFKGGDNRANHGHLDLGSFVLDAKGVRWVSDLGGERYSVPQYFGPRRWDYFRTRTESHNVFTFGGRNQDPEAVAPIAEFGRLRNAGYAICDLTPAYGDDAQSARRGVALLPDGNVLICDEIDSAESESEIHWGFTTEADAEADGPAVKLTQDGRELSVLALEPGGARFEVRAATRPDPESSNEGISRVGFVVPPGGREKAVRIAVLFRTGAQELGPPEVPLLDDWGEEVLRRG